MDPNRPVSLAGAGDLFAMAEGFCAKIGLATAESAAGRQKGTGGLRAVACEKGLNVVVHEAEGRKSEHFSSISCKCSSLFDRRSGLQYTLIVKLK